MKDALLQLPAHALLLCLRTLLPKLGDLEKENLFLRYQLLVLKRQVKRASPSAADRSVLATLAMSLSSWKQACFIVKPATLLAWHKRLAIRWTWDRRKPGRPQVTPDIRKLVIQIKREDRLWGTKRIHGELLKLGFTVSKSSVRNILRRARLDPWDFNSSGTWREFIKRHQNVWGMDFFTVHSATLNRYFVLVLMNLKTRELICTRVTAHPTAEWVSHILRGELAEREAPAGIIMDRDPAFEAATVGKLLKARGIHQLRCPKRTPIANAIVERLNGTLQRECTDHFLFFSVRQLQRALNEFRNYYNHSRCHQALGQRTPLRLAREHSTESPDPSSITKDPVLGGLHHCYRRIA